GFGGGEPHPVITPDTLERILGRNDLVNIDFFKTMTVRAQAVCLMQVAASGELGTGSLITSRLLITNNHVIGSVEEARTTQVRFGFDHPNDPGKAFDLDPDTFFVTSSKDDLDYTIVAVKGDEAELKAYGSLPLAPQVVPLLAVGEPMSIIQ